MAKARRPSAAKRRTSPKAKSSKPAKKAAAKKAPKRKVKAAAKPAAKVVELKKIREQFGAVLSALSTRRSADPTVTTKLDSARARLSQMMTDLDEICEGQEACGPDMIFPLP